MSKLQWIGIYSIIRTCVACCYDVSLSEVWYGIRYWTACLGRSFWLLRQEMCQEEHSYTPTGSIGCGKERGWEERTNAVLIVLFNFVPRLPENLSHSLSLFLSLFFTLSLSLTLAMRICSLYATWHKRNTRSGTFQDIGAQSDWIWWDNEISHQVHRSNLWNNKYCRASNVIPFLACIQKITMPTVIDFSSQAYQS
jgi:hypothetical protein